MLRLTCVVFLIAAVAAAEVQNGTVRSGGQPIPGASVTADCGADKISTVTDVNGRFEMGGLPSSSCHFAVAMFGFETSQRDASASQTALTFDLQLQTRATVPAVPQGKTAPETAPKTPSPVSAATPPSVSSGRTQMAGNRPAGASSTGAGQARRQGPGRGGNNALSANAGNTPGFQSLNLQQNGEAPAEGEIAPGGPAGDAAASGANEAFLVNGTISQAVQSQPGDGFGMGGPGGFGRGDFGPGGPGGNGFGANGQDGAGGPGGPGGPGGGGFGGGRGGGGFGGGGGRGGGFGGGRGPGRGGPGANGRTQFGNRINRGRGQQWRLTAQYALGNSALNARPYSFTAPALFNGEPTPKAAYANNRFGFSVGGPLEIPHLFKSDKTFWFVNYTGVRSKTGFDDITTVPTAQERVGNFGGLTDRTGNPVTIFDPLTNAPFAGNVIPASRISPVASALLSFIPLPNAPGFQNNYQLIGANPSNSNNLQVVVNQTISAKDRLAANVSYQNRDSANIQAFGFRDPSTGSGINSSLTYSRTFSRNLINSLGFTFSRNVTNQYSFFSNTQDIEGSLGIGGVFDTPLTYGPPTLSFTNFGSLSDGLPSLTRAQTAGLTESLIQIHGKHTITYGGLFQRRQNNVLTTQGARGTYNFTGVATQELDANGLPVSGTGYDLADYLLDRPYRTSVDQYLNGNNSYYYRETVGSAYVSDDWRWKGNFSLISGLRWEFFGPYTEKNNRLADLDLAAGYTGVAVVTPNQTGPLTNIAYPSGLIKPQYKLFSPREGLAWKPWKARQVVVRAGYGIYYTGGVYSAFTTRLGLQQPFVNAINQTTSPENVLTIENGFTTLPQQKIQNTFGVDPNYKPAYAQSWNFSTQETFFRTYVIQVGYQGTKGTHLDVLESPNRAAPGSSQTTQQRLEIQNASQFTYDLSQGDSTYNALQISLFHRMARNRSFNLTYVFSKSIDDTSTLGGGVVQIVNDIHAERALSNNDQRHRLSGTFSIQSPVGPDRTSWRWHALRGWTLNGNITAVSGSPFNPTVSGDPSGTGITGGARAQATGLPVDVGSGYFNPAAYVIPAAGTYGNAGRNTIPGIPNFSMNASVFRTFRFQERHQITFTVSSTNPLNHVNVTGIGTVIGSINEGLPLAAAGMRTLTAQTRFTF